MKPSPLVLPSPLTFFLFTSWEHDLQPCPYRHACAPDGGESTPLGATKFPFLEPLRGPARTDAQDKIS